MSTQEIDILSLKSKDIDTIEGLTAEERDTFKAFWSKWGWLFQMLKRDYLWLQEKKLKI